MTLSTSTTISDRTNVYAEREMLKHAEPVMVLGKFGMHKKMPKNKTTTINFRRAVTLEAITTPLAEGVTPKTTAFRYDIVEGTLKQYGMVMGLTDVIEDTHEDPVLNDMTMVCGENAGRSAEALTYGVLKAGTNVRYANGTQRSDVNTVLTLGHQRAVIRDLKAQKAMKVSRMLAPGSAYGTSAVESAYIGICHTDLENDIRNLPGFIPTVKYGTRSKLCDEEIGAVEEVRYITSPDLDPFLDAGGTPTGVVSNGGSAADVYPILYIGQDAYATVALKSDKELQALEPIIIPVGSKTKDDPLGQRGYVGWKGWHLCLITNDLWMQRLEVAATSL